MTTFPFAKYASQNLALLATAGLLALGLTACGAAESPEADNAEGAQAIAAEPADGPGAQKGEGIHDKRGRHGKKDPAAFLARFDENKDGKLAVAELPEKMRDRVGGADTDKDGFLSIDELKAHAPAGPDGHHGPRGMKDPAAMMEKFDANKDGKLAVSEMPEKMQEHMGEVDANKDGFVTADEFKARAEQHAKERFAKKDTNSDGALTEAEVGADHWEHMKVADANSDAKVTLAELEEARASGKMKGKWGKGEGRRGGQDR
jgi:Ca2+-binding EF-hand superfamily protein